MLDLFNKNIGDGQPNKTPLRKRNNVDDVRLGSPFGFKSNYFLSSMDFTQRSARPSDSSQGEGSSKDGTVHLKSLSVKGFQVLSLGEIEWKNPRYHSKEYIWPAGYTVKRTMKSMYSEDSAVAHIIEIQPPIDRISEPIFKLTVSNTVKCEAKGSSEQFVSFLRSINAKNTGTLYDGAGVRLLGLNKPNVFQAILDLPHADKCSNLSQKVKKKIPCPKPAMGHDGSTMSIVDEMKACQLPPGIEHVPMPPGRPFECQICCDIEEDEDDTVIQCDKCKGCVHMSCYSVQEAPNGRLWLCDVCRYHPKDDDKPDCFLCPVKGGVMKRTTCGKWCHPICALWLPETSILRDCEYQELRGLIDGIDLIHKSRMTSVCMFCKQKHGAVIQCCVEGTDCFRAFHFLCAKGQMCTHELVIDGDGEDHHADQTREENTENESVQPAKKKRKKSNPKNEKKGTIVGHCGRLKVYCPKHSLKSTSKIHASSNIDSNSNVEIECHRFRNKNVAEWLEDRKNIKKTYVQALALSLGTATPMTEEGQQQSVPTFPTYTCINAGDGISSEVSTNRETGVTTTVVHYTNPEERTLVSVGEKYSRLVDTWKKFIFPGKSAIHGWGAFTTKKLSPGDMVIEYVGELVRPSVAEMRERLLYDTLVGAGTYVFRLNANFCVDATRSGNLAHLLNHACSPNCASRTITVTHNNGATMDYVIIFALRDIEPGEELTYDYRFCGEEILHCSCGSAECRGMVNQDVPAWAQACWAPASMVKPVNFDTLP